MEWHLSPIGSQTVLFVMAVDKEYGPHLQERFHPLLTGVGPVEAALVSAATLQELQMEERLPDLVVCLGSAGSKSLEQTEIYQASCVSYRDIDASPLGFEKGETPFSNQPVCIPLPYRIPGVPEARLSTGGQVISGAAYETIDADMVDMETFAVLRACQRFTIPLISLRGISDGASELRHVGDWTEYLHVIDEKLARTVDALTEALIDGNLEKR